MQGVQRSIAPNSMAAIMQCHKTFRTIVPMILISLSLFIFSYGSIEPRRACGASVCGSILVLAILDSPDGEAVEPIVVARREDTSRIKVQAVAARGRMQR